MNKYQFPRTDLFVHLVVMRVCFVFLFALASGCADTPRVAVTASTVSNNAQFSITRKGGNGLTSMEIWQPDKREMLWAVDLNYFRGTSITYGTVPQGFEPGNGVIRRATQGFPAGGQKPLALPANSTFFLLLVCQYDRTFAAATEDFFFKFSTDEKGVVLSMSSTERPAAYMFPTNSF